MNKTIRIDDLITIVKKGGTVKTGVDVYNQENILLHSGDVLINSVKTLMIIKEKGVNQLPFCNDASNGVWDENGSVIRFNDHAEPFLEGEKTRQYALMDAVFSDTLSKKLYEIDELKIIASEKYDKAKNRIKKVLYDIRTNGGEFDYSEVEDTVIDLIEFLTIKENAFSYLTKEIFSYDDYLYNHSVNVCTVGTAVVNRFNDSFSAMVNDHLKAVSNIDVMLNGTRGNTRELYRCYMADEVKAIATGLFLHDVGKVLIPDSIINKTGGLTNKEFDIVKKHSTEFGLVILEKNRINNPFLESIIKYHHASLYDGEERCYPEKPASMEIPIYAKIAKLADIYDAMTSKRSYKEAFNQINVVTEIFRKYARRYQMLQFVLHSFVKSIGIYPPGSVLYLRNGQMAFVLESQGPIVLPFTEPGGGSLRNKPEPVDISNRNVKDELKVDNRRSIKTQREVYDFLPEYLKVRHRKSFS